MLLEIQYCGTNPEEKPILLAGKGITFDSGGLCLKKCKKMDRYRADMNGAAVLVATMRAAAALSLPINLTAIIPVCENMPSGMAMKCGDVVMGLNGKSIMIRDTDNEGRLLLADAMAYGQNTHKPKLIIGKNGNFSVLFELHGRLIMFRCGHIDSRNPFSFRLGGQWCLLQFADFVVSGPQSGRHNGRPCVAYAALEVLHEEGHEIQVS